MATTLVDVLLAPLTRENANFVMCGITVCGQRLHQSVPRRFDVADLEREPKFERLYKAGALIITQVQGDQSAGDAAGAQEPTEPAAATAPVAPGAPVEASEPAPVVETVSTKTSKRSK